MKVLRPRSLFSGATLSLLASTLAAAAPAISEKDKSAPPVMMQAFKVEKTSEVKLSFGVSLDVWNAGDGKTQSIVVRRVRSGSDAADQGIIPFTRIYRIDGRPVEEFDATLRRDSGLGKLFVARQNGDQIVLEIGIPGQPDTKVIVLTEHHTLRSQLSSLTEQVDR